MRTLLRADDAGVSPKAYAHNLAKATADKYRGKRRPGEVMSRAEAMDLGGEEMGPLLHRLANAGGKAVKPRAARTKKG